MTWKNAASFLLSNICAKNYQNRWCLKLIASQCRLFFWESVFSAVVSFVGIMTCYCYYMYDHILNLIIIIITTTVIFAVDAYACTVLGNLMQFDKWKL